MIYILLQLFVNWYLAQVCVNVIDNKIDDTRSKSSVVVILSDSTTSVIHSQKIFVFNTN